jgi:hypothetical protein
MPFDLPFTDTAVSFSSPLLVSLTLKANAVLAATAANTKTSTKSNKSLPAQFDESLLVV